MFKKTIKLAGLLMLLLLSFIYTDRVFSSARESDPIMLEVVNYKKKKDVMPIEPTINGDEIILGTSGIIVDAKKSYNNMKDNDKFDEEKIVYENKTPKETITNTYKYYIKKGNSSKKRVAIIFKIRDDQKNYSNLLTTLNKKEIKVSFFVDGTWLSNNADTAFKIVNQGYELYNLGYNGVYDKKMVSVTNNLIESITLKNSNLCLNDNKDEDSKKVCDKKRMHTLVSTLNSPSISELKEGLSPGAIISYDASEFDISSIGIIINTITSRGYEIESLSSIIKE